MDLTTILIGLAIDVVVILTLVFAVYRPRHKKADLALSYVVLNLGVFGAVALVLGLVNSLGATWLPFMVAINVLLLGSLVVLDPGAAAIASRPTEKRRVVLDVVHDDHAALCADLTARLRTPVVAATVEEVDYVREVMVVVVEVETPRMPEPAPAGHEPLDTPVAGARSWALR